MNALRLFLGWSLVSAFVLGLSVLMAGFASAQPISTKAKIIIVLDDVGYRQTDIDAFSLPKEVAFSILPQTPHARFYAELANEQGRDVMLHLPMASTHAKNLGPAALQVGMIGPDIEQTLEQALQSVPYVIGVNNHMGSRLTTQPSSMRELMKAIKQRSLFFLDSRTTPRSIAYETAKEMGIPTDKRHIFLDHQQTEAFYQQQFDRLVRIANKYGRAIGIAHPYPSSIEFLSRTLANIDELGVELYPVSEFFDVDNVSPRDNRSRRNVQIAAPSED